MVWEGEDRRRGGRPRRRFIDAVREDMQEIGVTEEERWSAVATHVAVGAAERKEEQ